MSDLPSEYDVIICGTGLTESILSAGLSRIGKSVLHIDRELYYGGEFSSHSLTSLIDWTNRINEENSNCLDKNTDNTEIKYCNNTLFNNYYTSANYKWNSTICSDELKNELLKASRNFSIDLCPNIFYSRGSLIELLISSDVSKYCEFRMVTQILTQNQEDGHLEKVPTSRSDVFKTDQLKMIEKRHMMKFIQSCVKDNEFADLIEGEDVLNMSFRDFIKQKKLPESVSNYIMNAVAMSPNENQSALQGLNEIKKFLASVGRFGESPFIYSSYGTGEIPQCFSRMSAVFGGIFHLNLTINDFQVNKETNLIESIRAAASNKEKSYLDQDEKKFTCKHLILDSSYVPLEYFQPTESCAQISRAILITDKSLFSSSKSPEENISLLFVPQSSDSVPSIYCIEASSSSSCVPKGYYLVYLFCDQANRNKPEDDFKTFLDLFFEKKISKDDEAKETGEKVECTQADDSTEENKSNQCNKKPNILFECFYSHYNSGIRVNNCQSSFPSNLLITTASNSKLDFDDQVSQAQEIFKKICPDDEFLPKPPAQEDIIFDHESEGTTSDIPAEENKEKLEVAGTQVVNDDSIDKGNDSSKETSTEYSPTLVERDGKKSKTDTNTENL